MVVEVSVSLELWNDEMDLNWISLVLFGSLWFSLRYTVATSFGIHLHIHLSRAIFKLLQICLLDVVA